MPEDLHQLVHVDVFGAVLTVRLDRPDKRGRSAILKVHLRKIALAPGVDPDQIAALTPGFTGADLANLANEAALLATRQRADSVTFDDFVRAIERILAGPEKKNRVLSVTERKVVAHHEMGHALLAHHLEHADPPHKISIIGRGMALGYAVSLPREDRFTRRKVELMAQIGRAHV